MHGADYAAHPGIIEAHDGYVETFFRQHFDYDALPACGHPYRCVDPGTAIQLYLSIWGVAVNAEQHLAKIRDCLSVRLQPPQISQAVDLLANLERLTVREIGQLIALLA